MNLNFSKIFFITFISIVIALIYNHFNPNGLNLLRVEKILNWESDSLASFSITDSLITETKLVYPKQSVDSDLRSDRNNKVEPFKEPKAIKINFAYKLFNQGIQFIDARSRDEFTDGHIKGAVNIPFYSSENYAGAISKLDKNEIVVTYCESAECDIAILSGDELFKMGFKKVYVFIGGYNEWIKNHYPISININ